MKKNWVLVVAVAVAIGFVSCKAKESSYKAAYEKAQEKPVAEQTLAPEPVVTKPGLIFRYKFFSGKGKYRENYNGKCRRCF